MQNLSSEELLQLLKSRKQILEENHFTPYNILEKIKIKLGFKIKPKIDMPLEIAIDIVSDYPIGIREYLLSPEKIREIPELKKEYQELLLIVSSKKKEAFHRIAVG